MPFQFQDTIRPNSGPTVINGFDPTISADFLQAVSDQSTLTSVQQTADTNDFRVLDFEDGNVGMNFFTAEITRIEFNIMCNVLKFPMDMEITLQDNVGPYPSFTLTADSPDLTTVSHDILTNSASDPITANTVKGMQLRTFTTTASNNAGQGSQFRLTIAEIFLTIHSTSPIPTRTITLDSGAINLNSGTITVQ